MNAHARQHIGVILDRLEERFPSAGCELSYRNPFELLVATVLSAQCTDVRVNAVTKTLFERCRTPEDLIAIGHAELERLIFSCGFYRNKAANLIALSHALLERYGGRVPESFDELLSLPGVGRKTANVVCGEAFGGQTIAVDTHVFRVSHRLGLSSGKTPDSTEAELLEVVPKARRTRAHHLLIFLGRYICRAQRPDCAHCPVIEFCTYHTISPNPNKNKE